MSALTRERLANTGTLAELYPQLAEIGLGAGWNKPTPSLWPAPHPSFPPAHWRYAQAQAARSMPPAASSTPSWPSGATSSSSIRSKAMPTPPRARSSPPTR